MEQSTVTQEIIVWAHGSLPEWQSDLVRRYLESGSILKDDIDEIYPAVLTDAGIELPDDKQPPRLRKPELGTISGAPQESTDVSLKAIRALQNVNQIPDGSVLTFGETGLTVIYGENGAGKSGWARLLKRACRAKDKELPILSNVYEDSDNGQASAVFEVLVEGQDCDEISWIDGSEPNAILTNVTVFDSKAAGAIVNDDNTFTYVPDAMNVFQKLADVTTEIRERLEREKPQLVVPSIPGLDLNSPIGQGLADLHNAESIERLNSMAVWTETDSGNLESLNQRVATINAADVRNRIDSQKAQIQRFEYLSNLLTARFQLVNQSSQEIYSSQGQELMECQKAAKIASRDKLMDEPLNGAGSDAWEKLYRAAKAFSEESAYPDRAYPPVDSGDRCVLCMQELSPDARTRMTRFKEFVEGEVQSKLEEAREHVKESRRNLESLIDVITDPTIGPVIEEVEALDNEISTYLSEWIDRSNVFRSLALDRLGGKELSGDFHPLENPESTIGLFIARLKQENEKLQATLDPSTADSLRNELIELKSRKVAFDHWSEIEAYWSIIEESRRYGAAIDQLNTTSITRKSKEMMSGFVSDQLNSAVADELSQLGAKRLSVGLSGRGEKGALKYRYALANLASTDPVNLQRVLSEGEQRVVALAGFLAEENLTGLSSAIIFDDPVSSLDHLFREKIADRLAKESQNRQVIVFTHDIAFLVALSEKCPGQTLKVRTLLRGSGAVGKPSEQLPWHTMRVNQRIHYLRSELSDFKELYEDEQAEYDQRASRFYGLLRETWEAAVEELLFNRTVERHGNAVKTQSLREVIVTHDLYFAIDTGMSRCSSWMTGHDKSKLISDHRPDPDEVAQDIDALEVFAKHIKTIRNTVGKERASTPPGFNLEDTNP